MTIDEIHEFYHFNWTELTRELNLGKNTYQGWVRKGYIPMSTQIRIEKITSGKLKSELTKKGG